MPVPPDTVPTAPRRYPVARVSRAGAIKVPQITAAFWVTKAVTTALGESTSDYLVHRISPVLAVLLGAVCFAAALWLQFRARRYLTRVYWLAVVMVAVFGTMAADVLHVGFGVPYAVSTVLFAVVLAAVFILWQRTEHTLSIHSVDRPRREVFYWATVCATFALGTAAGDMSAYTLHLGYFASAFLFGGLILVPALAYRARLLGGVAAFWACYVLTRPVGASVADWLGKPRAVGGLGFGAGLVSLGGLLVFLVLVAVLVRRERDAVAPGRAGGDPAVAAEGAA